MAKQIELRIPTSYDDITLRKWLALQGDLKNYEDDEEAQTALMLHHLCGLQPEWLKGIAVEDYNRLKWELSNFINKTDLELQRIIHINGKEYGFEPNLSNMAYGAYADITAFTDIQIDSNWAKIMDILYRPVKSKQFDNYVIQPYTGEVKPDKWLDVPMSVHFGALFFLYNLLMDLLSATLKSSMEVEAPHNIKPILQRSGHHMLQSLSSQMVISPASTLFPNNHLKSV